MPLYSALICVSTNKQTKLCGSLRMIQLRLKGYNTTSLETNYRFIYIQVFVFRQKHVNTTDIHYKYIVS